MGSVAVRVRQSPWDLAVEVVREEVTYALRRAYPGKAWTSAAAATLAKAPDHELYERRRYSIDETVCWLRRKATCSTG